MARAADVLIVGGGVVGLATAYALARAGVPRVLLLERGGLGREASRAAAGILAPQAEAAGPGPFLTFALAGRARYDTLAPELRERTGIDIEHRPAGTLYLGDVADEAARGRAAWQRALGLRVEEVSGGALRQLEPGLSEAIRGALFFPDEGTARPCALVEALAAAARDQGVGIREGVEALDFVLDGDRLLGVRTPEEIILAETLVACAGAWSGQLLARLGRRLPMEPIRGQMVRARLDRPPLERVAWGPLGYVVPRLSGEVLVGSTVEPAGFDSRPTVDGVRALTAAGVAMVPGLADAEFDQAWAGLRPRLADGLPAIGRLTDIPNLILATGHYRNGILLGPLTGELVADLILGKPLSIDLEPFSPRRFGL